MPRPSIENAAIELLVRLYGVAGKAGVWRLPGAERVFLASYFAYKRLLEDPLTMLARRRPELFAGGHALDVGANVGYTARVLAAAVPAPYRIVAFEPDAVACVRLRRTAAAGRLGGRIEVVEAAVGEGEGTVLLRHNPRHPADHRVVPSSEAAGARPQTDRPAPAAAATAPRRVPLVSLDGYCAEHGLDRVGFVKIDTQGYELPVCLGAERLLAANPDLVMALELAPQAMRDLGYDPEHLWRWIADHGLTAHLLDRSVRLPAVGPDDLAPLLAARGYADLLLYRPGSRGA